MSGFRSFGIVGAGAWGTALANAAARAGRDVTLWARDAGHVAEMAATRRNERRLPDVTLEERVQPSADLGALRGCEAILLVTPAQSLGEIAAALALVMRPGTPIVLCAKGIDRATGHFLADLAADAFPRAPIAVLSGPSFAADVARGLPTAVSVACSDAIIAQALALSLTSASFRLYHGTDVRGVEIGGAGKNVLAVACGVAIGRGLGESARAALVARGFAELMRFATAYGARPETLMGLSGLGDLVLTCGSPQSRNFAFGLKLGQGQSRDEAAAGKLAEGVMTAPVLVALARAREIDMPIASAVSELISGRVDVDGAMAALLNRPPKAELG
jgi:glycerol-3-phosphate dehydrogenase (NAD(P)+)